MFTPSPALNKYASIEQALTPPDPVGAGAAKGIQAAKASLSMTPPRAPRTSPIGRGLGALMANMQTPRPGTGVAGNLHSMAMAMGPAVSAYQDAQDRDAVYELELWKMQHEQMRHAEERALDERKMAEAERHNKAWEGIHGRQVGVGMGAEENPALAQFPVIADKGSLTKILGKKNASASLLHEGNKIKSAIADLERERGTFDPFNPLPGTIGVKDFLATRLGNESNAKERLARKKLDALSGAFNQSVEKALKGGVLSGQMIRYAEEKGLFPDREHDTVDEYKAKLEALMSKLSSEHQAADLSYKYRRAIDPLDLDALKGSMGEIGGEKTTPPGAAASSMNDDTKARLMQELERRKQQGLI